MDPELERALAFEAALRARCTDRVVPFSFGRAFFTDRFPHVWYLNGLEVDARSDVDPEALVAEAEDLHAGAGHGHRRVDVRDDGLGGELAPFFRGLGWQAEHDVVMADRGAGERTADTPAVEEVTVAELRPLREAFARGEPWGTDEAAVREVLDANGIWSGAGNGRHFAMRAEGGLVSAADLYSDGKTAQVEDVVTLPAHRGHGHASAVVLRAAHEARAAGHDFVFLVADDDGWPKELYARLGFEAVGRTWSFLRTPTSPSEAPPAPSRGTAAS